jgi:hypothetical protein
VVTVSLKVKATLVAIVQVAVEVDNGLEVVVLVGDEDVAAVDEDDVGVVDPVPEMAISAQVR